MKGFDDSTIPLNQTNLKASLLWTSSEVIPESHSGVNLGMVVFPSKGLVGLAEMLAK